MEQEILSEVRRKNREISEKRIRGGKIFSKIYAVIYILAAVSAAVVTNNFIFLWASLPMALGLLLAFSFGRHLYSFGNIAYGLYVFYVFSSVLPYKKPAGYVYLMLIAFLGYIIFSSIRVFSSEKIKAYIEDKNSL
jgi:uncharacterized integral membrane protein